MAIPQQCCEIKNYKVITLHENRSIFNFYNPNRKNVTCVVVDGCAIINGPKCDHLLIDANLVEHFVELKGSDVKHALLQLERSIEQLGVNTPRYAFVVSTKCPMIGADIQRAKKKFKVKYDTNLIIKNSPCEHSHS